MDERPARLIHLVPGRMRVHLRECTADEARRLAGQVGGMAGVSRAVMNPLTGRLLVHFDPATTTGEALLQGLPDLGRAGQAGQGLTTRQRPGSSRAARRGQEEGEAERTNRRRLLKGIAAMASLLHSVPLLQLALRLLVGPTLADIVCSAASVVSLLLRQTEETGRPVLALAS